MSPLAPIAVQPRRRVDRVALPSKFRENRGKLALPSLPVLSIISGLEAETTGVERFAITEHRVGCGHDTHRLRPGGPLRLGGVSIPHDQEFEGHSDADVLLHAVTDALLGAAGLGDIGELFPDTDPQWRGADSGQLLQAAWRRAAKAGWRIGNLDCIVFLQRPKLSAHKETIRGRIAELLEIAPEQVNVKAKTGESIGAIGRGEAGEALCVALIERDRP